MRGVLTGLAVVIGLSMNVTVCQAQLGASGDPFFLYYGYYLPRQQSLAALSAAGTQGTISSNVQARQFNAMTERSGLAAPIQPFGLGELDPMAPVGAGRAAGPMYGATRLMPGQEATLGHPIYHNRTAGYYPGLRTGGPTPNPMAGGTGFQAPRGRPAMPRPAGAGMGRMR